jgi:hypothetical protein
MDWLIEIVKIAVATGIATTFDDNIYLTGFFSRRRASRVYGLSIG